MSWVTVQLGDFITLKRGYDLPERARVAGNIPIVSSSGVTGTHNEAKVDGPGVVTGRYGTLGEVFYIDEPFWPLNTALYVQDFKGNQRRFVSYFLKSILSGIQSDKAAVPGVNRNDLHARNVLVTNDLQEQATIASILSAYDALIENNRRRIQLLEDSARLLYKEWFVRLRFPGHEHVKVVDGVPEGWEKKALGEVAPLSYGKALKQEIRIPGSIPVYGSSGEVGSHNKALVKGPGIILGRKGNVGSVFWSSNDFFPIDTVYFLSNEKASLYLYYVLMHMAFINTDVAVPGLNRDFAHSREMFIPADTVLMLFDEQIRPVHRQIDCLNEYNRALAQARDLLLPRLMNNEVAL